MATTRSVRSFLKEAAGKIAPAGFERSFLESKEGTRQKWTQTVLHILSEAVKDFEVTPMQQDLILSSILSFCSGSAEAAVRRSEEIYLLRIAADINSFAPS